MTIAPMRSDRLHFLLPFSLPAAAVAPVALAQLELPGLAKLLRAARAAERSPGEDFQRNLPHEYWLCRRFGVVAETLESPADQAARRLPLAPYMLLGDGGAPGAMVWACIEPVHIQIAHDHLILIDPHTLALPPDQARALFDAALPSFPELGLQVVAPTPLRWYVSGAALGMLDTASPLRAAGRSVEIWLPHEAGTGQRSRPWMKLQNEVQMAWFEHPVNQTREALGRYPANSIWLHGQGQMGPAHASHGAATGHQGGHQGEAAGALLHNQAPATRPFEHVLSDSVVTRGLGLASGAEVGTPPATFALWHESEAAAAAGSRETLIELALLAEPFIQEDWASWQAALLALDRDWFSPAAAELAAGRLSSVTFTLCGETESVSMQAKRPDLLKFWRRQPLAALLSAQ